MTTRPSGMRRLATCDSRSAACHSRSARDASSVSRMDSGPLWSARPACVWKCWSETADERVWEIVPDIWPSGAVAGEGCVLGLPAAVCAAAAAVLVVVESGGPMSRPRRRHLATAAAADIGNMVRPQWTVTCTASRIADGDRGRVGADGRGLPTTPGD